MWEADYNEWCWNLNTGGVNRLEVMVDHRIVGESAGMRGKDRSW